MQRNTDGIYYNHSGYFDPTAGAAITLADVESELKPLRKKRKKKRKRRKNDSV